MTRKDYILIAEVLRVYRKQETDHASANRHAIDGVTRELCDALKRDNASFDKEHFLAVVRGERELHSKPRRKTTKPNAGLMAMAAHPGWRE